MLKLFRDYLFHTVTDDGRPWLDHAHILQCLNKLDAGTTEKVFKSCWRFFLTLCRLFWAYNQHFFRSTLCRATNNRFWWCPMQSSSIVWSKPFPNWHRQCKGRFQTLALRWDLPSFHYPPHFLCVQNRCCKIHFEVRTAFVGSFIWLVRLRILKKTISNRMFYFTSISFNGSIINKLYIAITK